MRVVYAVYMYVCAHCRYDRLVAINIHYTHNTIQCVPPRDIHTLCLRSASLNVSTYFTDLVTHSPKWSCPRGECGVGGEGEWESEEGRRGRDGREEREGGGEGSVGGEEWVEWEEWEEREEWEKWVGGEEWEGGESGVR